MRTNSISLIASLFMAVAIIVSSSSTYAQFSGDLEESGPIVATFDGQIIENVRITAIDEYGINVDNVSNVIIRNVEIFHDGAHGIRCTSAPGIIIENVSITHTGVQTPLPASENNINCQYSEGLRIRNARLTGGSSGVYVLNSPHAHLSYIEGYNFQGPFPRGQLAQFNKSPNCILEDFSAINDPDISWPEDNVSIYYSDNCVVRRGLLDGNNSRSGVGVMFEGSTVGLVEDVDTIRQANGSFSAYPSWDITYRRTTARENICTDQGRGAPSSNALMWAGNSASSGLRVEDSRYWLPCNSNLIWNRNSFDVIQLTEEDYTLRDPIVLEFWWESGDTPPPTPEPEPEPPLDTEPPNVEILSPSDGSTVTRMSLVQVNTEATDDFGVKSVRLLIGGKVVATFLGNGPYTHRWKVKSKFGKSVIISVQAKDKSGNLSEATVSVRVVKRARRN